MRQLHGIGVCLGLICFALESQAQFQSGGFDPNKVSQSPAAFETLAPTIRKSYLSQPLYQLYGWQYPSYTNFSTQLYEPYAALHLEGDRLYDMFGQLITRGWKVYDWRQRQSAEFGSEVLKTSTFFGGWFNRLVISSAVTRQFYMALSIGEELRTTLTPLTFSKPAFDGLQWDFQTDRYALTFIGSRIDAPGRLFGGNNIEPSRETSFTNLLGGRALVQMGAFAHLGLSYINAAHGNTSLNVEQNSLKGVLGGRLNADNISFIEVRLSDDSPEDGTGGARLLHERLFVDGVEHAEIRPLVVGGQQVGQGLEANGLETITLHYDVAGDFVAGVRDSIADFKQIHRLEVELVLSRDYRVEISSNMQTNLSGEAVFLTAASSPGNIHDDTNQKILRLPYGLPTANEILAATFEISEWAGLNVRTEFALNRRHRRFPNQQILKNHALATDRAKAFYLTASYRHYPFFGHAEVFSMDPAYNTSMFLSDPRGFIDFENEFTSRFEFVDDNDDQDRFPDWRRRTSVLASVTEASRQSLLEADRAVFPGLDENNDQIHDFNQNNNLQPDYVEPFLRYHVDPPEFLFGVDMNHNGTIDRFENDTEPDFPYKRDHRGYNVYAGVEFKPGLRLSIGTLDEHLLSNGRRSRSAYLLFSWQQEVPGYGLHFRVMECLRRVQDHIADDLIQWVQQPAFPGVLVEVEDPLMAANALINTAYLDFEFTGVGALRLAGRFKGERYFQQGQQPLSQSDEDFLGTVLKAEYPWHIASDILLMSRAKQVTRQQTSVQVLNGRRSEISEIFSLSGIWTLIPQQMQLEAGIEGEFFYDLVDRKDPQLPLAGNAQMFTLAAQLRVFSDYLGYRLITDVGLRRQRRINKSTAVSNTLFFVSAFAGLR